MTNITRSTSLPSSVTRSTLEDWLNTIGVRIGEIPEIRVDLSESDSVYTFHADIPGVNKEDIKIEVEGQRVSINVEKSKTAEKEDEKFLFRERSEESIHRSFRLDQEIDEDNATANYKDGVLELVLPKKRIKAFKQVEIK